MGSGIFQLIILCMVVGLSLCGCAFSLVGLIYKHIDENVFQPKYLWLSIGFAALLILGICGLADNIAYDKKHEEKSETTVNAISSYEEVKTYDIYIKNGETYKNATNAILQSNGYLSFDTEDGKHLSTNAETVVEVHTEIIKK